MVSITLATQAGPHYQAHGEYHHAVQWQTTGRDGYIVQHVAMKVDWSESIEASHTLTRDYWEAWRVDSAGNIYPARTAHGVRVHDYFKLGARGPSTAGKWRIKTSVYWMSGKNFVASEWAKVNTQGGAMFPAAGALYHRVSHPGVLKLGLAKLTRNEAGLWNSRSAIAHQARS